MEIADVHLVRVRTDDHEFRIYAVRTERKNALTKVLEAVPEGYDANISQRYSSMARAYRIQADVLKAKKKVGRKQH